MMSAEKQEKIALFRFGVIAPLVGLKNQGRGAVEQMLRQITQREWEIPDSRRSYVSRSVVKEWFKRYEASGGNLKSLCPKTRNDKGRLRSMDQETEQAILKLKKELGPRVTLPVFLQIARQRGILPPDFKASMQTVYRLFERHGLDEGLPPGIDRRKFEAELPNDLWQADIMHGPVIMEGKRKRKAFLFAIIDDHSRLIVHAGFYLNERLENFMDCLKKAVAKRGLPRKLYLDNGPAFRSHQLRLCLGSLGVELVHSKAYVPQGKGKIERWFRTCRMKFLPLLKDGLTLQAINQKLEEWLEGDYQSRVHDSTGQTPLERFIQKIELVRKAPSNLNDFFRIKLVRKVNNDRSISIDGKLFEAPVDLIGRTVTVLMDSKNQGEIEVFFKDKSFGLLVPLDRHINANAHRYGQKSVDESQEPKPTPSLEAQPPKSGQLF
jgi:transposase InsO family protein